jgi:hypothetical protein
MLSMLHTERERERERERELESKQGTLKISLIRYLWCKHHLSLCLDSIVGEDSTGKSKVEGSNPATGTERDKKATSLLSNCDNRID